MAKICNKSKEGYGVGSNKEKLEIAKKMKEEKFEIEVIAKITKLTEEEIKNLD